MSPVEFKKYKVKDLILSHMSGPSPTCEERQVASAEEWGLLKTTAVTWGGWDWAAHKVPPKVFWGKSNLEVQSGDVVVTKAGPRHRVGVVVYVDYTPPRIMVSGKMIGLRPDPAKVEYRVLAGALSQFKPQRYLDNRTTGMADSQLNFTNELLLNTEVELPPLPEQTKIGEVLSTVDQAIEQTEALIAKQQRIKIGLMQDLLTKGIDEQGNLRSEATHEFKDSPLGRVPVEWEVVTLGKVIGPIVSGWSPTCEAVPAPSGEWGVLKTTACVWSGYDESENKRLPAGLQGISKIEVNADDILVTRKGPVERVGVIVHIHKTREQLMIPDTVFKMRLVDDSRVLPAFLPLALGSAVVQSNWFQKKIGLADAQVNLNHSILRSTRFPKPKPEEQQLIVEVLRSSAVQSREEREYLIKLESLKTALMQDLLTGKKRVTPLLETATKD